MKSAFSDITKGMDNKYASIISDGIIGEPPFYIDTGSYTLNGILSGTIYGGQISNKCFVCAGDEATGKTFFALALAQSFHSMFDNSLMVYFETEFSGVEDLCEDRGVDPKRFMIRRVATVEKFRNEAAKILDNYEQMDSDERPPMFFILDSLGNLSTEKEIGDAKKGENIKDMSRAALIKGAFRVLRLQAGLLNVPVFVVNHTYATLSQYSAKEISGGSGAKYAGDVIFTVSKAKEKESDSGPQIGIIITVSLYKSRLVRTNIKAKTALRFDSGLHKYYGLIDWAIDAGLWSKVGNKIKIAEGNLIYKKHIYQDPERYFTNDVLNQIDEYVRKEFSYRSKQKNVKEG